MVINNKVTQDLYKYILDTYKIDVTQNDDMNTAFMELQHNINDALLGIYFQATEDGEQNGTYWKNQLAWDTRKTGKELLKKLNKLNPSCILDVGCGDNEWKQYFGDKLLGIDPYNTNADMQVGVMDITEGYGTWDVVMCLGSINFGDELTIKAQVQRAVDLCKPGGKLFFRCNPGITHGNEHAKWVDFYPWSEELLLEYANEFNCVVNETTWDQSNEKIIRWGNRLYSEWTKKL